jgi:hypothetical protein
MIATFIFYYYSSRIDYDCKAASHALIDRLSRFETTACIVSLPPVIIFSFRSQSCNQSVVLEKAGGISRLTPFRACKLTPELRKTSYNPISHEAILLVQAIIPLCTYSYEYIICITIVVFKIPKSKSSAIMIELLGLSCIYVTILYYYILIMMMIIRK